MKTLQFSTGGRSTFAIAAAVVIAFGMAWMSRPNITGLLPTWLSQFCFWLGIAIGSVTLHSILALGGSNLAGQFITPLSAATRTLPFAALLFIPVCIGAAAIYPWMSAHGTTRNMQGWHFNTPFFLFRSLVYFVVWIFSGWLLQRRDSTGHAALLIVLLFTTTLAADDWFMSLVPHWQSAVFGLRWFVDAILSAAAFATLAHCASPVSGNASGWRIDAGNLLLALSLGWLYLLFVEYVTIWSGNLPSEISWYLPRLKGGWSVVGALTMLAHLLAAALLISRSIKSNPRALAGIAALLLLAQWLGAVWMVLPSLRPSAIAATWTDAASVLLMGSIFVALLLDGLDARRTMGASTRG